LVAEMSIRGGIIDFCILEAIIIATEVVKVPEIIFANTRELKNRTNELLRKAAGGSWIIITRRGKPVASLKPFSNADLQEEQPDTALYRMLRERIAATQPHLPAMTAEELRVVNKTLSAKVQAFPSWEAMDRVAKGDPYGVFGQ